ncbi:myomesin-2-like, partial [Hippocampus comes]|uniref:myomesin-2-like n=1 Tax=Hippocampus comes TaxID=109280 RepID=UPI00094EF8A8
MADLRVRVRETFRCASIRPHLSQGRKISHDVSTGVIQMMVENFTRESEGTYTVQIHDGKAKTQSSLVLVGDVFLAALKEAELQRRDFVRKQGELPGL